MSYVSNLLEFWFELTNNLGLFRGRKLVSFPRHDRRHFKILSWWRRLCAPLESRQVPRIRLRALPVTPRASHKFDVVSTILSAIAFGTFVVLIDTAGREGSPLLIGTEVAIAVVSGILLWRRQLSLAAPLLPIDLLRIPVFALSIAVCASSFAAQMLALVVLPFHLTAAGYSATRGL